MEKKPNELFNMRNYRLSGRYSRFINKLTHTAQLDVLSFVKLMQFYNERNMVFFTCEIIEK